MISRRRVRAQIRCQMSQRNSSTSCATRAVRCQRALHCALAYKTMNIVQGSKKTSRSANNRVGKLGRWWPLVIGDQSIPVQAAVCTLCISTRSPTRLLILTLHRPSPKCFVTARAALDVASARAASAANVRRAPLADRLGFALLGLSLSNAHLEVVSTHTL